MMWSLAKMEENAFLLQIPLKKRYIRFQKFFQLKSKKTLQMPLMRFQIFLFHSLDGEIWICKPTGMNQGKGIYLIRNRDELEKRLGPKLEAQNSRSIPPPGRIVQRQGSQFNVFTFILLQAVKTLVFSSYKNSTRFIPCEVM